MSDTSAAHPTSSSQRLASLDVLRGFALLGILIMNIQGFAMISAAYSNPSLHMDLSGLNWWVWALSHAFADMKFMAIFSILFGAGIILATKRRDAAGRSSFAFFYRRNGWLLLFGLIHAYLIWFGDILVAYAVAAFVVFWFRGFRVRWLFLTGVIMLSVAPALSIVGLWLSSEEEGVNLVYGLLPSTEAIAAEIQGYQGSWFDAFGVRAGTSIELQSYIPIFLFWRAGGLMVIGMGLYKLGILSAERSPRFYWTMALVGGVIGLPLVVLSAVMLSARVWDPLFALVGPGQLLNYIGSLGIAAAYIALIMRLVQSKLWTTFQHCLAAVGQLAFTNYILQSMLCTAIFYGFGLGLFGQVERWGQVLIVVAVWVLQLALSPLWLKRFRFGPLEWLWRSLAYFKVQPFRR